MRTYTYIITYIHTYLHTYTPTASASNVTDARSQYLDSTSHRIQTIRRAQRCSEDLLLHAKSEDKPRPIHTPLRRDASAAISGTMLRTYLDLVGVAAQAHSASKLQHMFPPLAHVKRRAKLQILSPLNIVVKILGAPILYRKWSTEWVHLTRAV